MTKSLYCSDIVPGCEFVARGINENEVIMRATQHARAKHGLRELTPELLRRVIAAIRSENTVAADG